ncbi:hypothetical protein LCGC14_0953350 [marine sediment metagenome]|uniref:Uncharacterized protein n=1 Tax=marine sediment metagenome TaxID=412755 RepID=A0A0F9P2M8_9ZZZZ|nr:hypothetical protein [bacterium]
MTSVNRKKKLEKEKENLRENLFFHLDEDLIETEDDINRLKEILENKDISDNTKAAFRSANDFYEKFIKNNYTISLVEM